MTRYFHFTLGPVQSFVSQARRTRDFWAGSFLLSWLAAVAMREVQAQDGEIKFPRPDTDFMAALEGKADKPPMQGGVPNRFKAAVPDGFDPEQISTAVQTAWRALAAAVWNVDLAGLANAESAAIWQRQIDGFWEMQWVLTDDEKDSNCIDRMKNWRTHLSAPEPGPKCMMMDGWQEISGATRPNDTTQKTFWKHLLSSGRTGIATDLRQDEHLCAIAYVKRRFVRVFDTLHVPMPGGWTLKGWTLPSAVPSVQYMAVARWLAELLQKTQTDTELSKKMWAFHDEAQELTGSHGEWGSNIRCVDDAKAPRKWSALDGGVFFDSMLENTRLWGERAKLAPGVLDKLKRLRKQAELGPISPFYAILRMDGDELGKQMSAPEKQDAITQGLADFARGVPGIVEENSGFLIYAGGDDVLALSTLEDALKMAAEVRQHYKQCFKNNTVGIQTSISAAIEYVHVKTPLAKALDDSHHLLDNIAKDAAGRDALAVRVWKPGGLALEWAMPWDEAIQLDGKVAIEQLAHEFRNAEGDAEGMSTKFFYGLRERFAVLNPAAGEQPVLTPDQQRDLLAMQFLNSGVNRKAWKLPEARKQIDPLITQCRPRKRTRDNAGNIDYQDRHPGVIEVDGALLVRFLAHKGVEVR